MNSDEGKYFCSTFKYFPPSTDEGEAVYEVVRAGDTVSSGASSLSQATVRLARGGSSSGSSPTNTSTAFSNINICSNNLYARVDVKMKRKPPAAAASPVSPTPDTQGKNRIYLCFESLRIPLYASMLLLNDTLRPAPTVKITHYKLPDGGHCDQLTKQL